MTIADKEFKRARERMKMTQGELAKRLDVAVRTVIRWENDSHGRIPKAVELAMKQIEAENSK